MIARILARRNEAGYAAILVAMLAASILFPLSALAVDVSRWYVEAERVQNAADAAAMAGVTYMPSDFANAKVTALAVAARNGYPNSGNSTVTVEVGAKPTQLKVTVTGKVHNNIAASFTTSYTTVARSAVADYNGPAPMGSPCNTFGNEPAGTTNAGPVASQLVPPSGGATCSTTPKFWANIHGPNVAKTQGDEFMSRYCTASEDGCASSGSPRLSTEFNPLGYFYIVRVGAAAVGVPVTIQLYDPAYVSTGSRCNLAPAGTLANSMNTYTTSDGLTRYQYGGTPNSFCAGDDPNSGTGLRIGSETTTVTSFGLRSPIDTFVPTQAAPISSCVKQYPGYTAAQVTATTLKTGTGYNADLAAVFHQWVPLCTFTPTRVGDYYLQMRTNVALSTANPDGRGGYNGNMAVFNQTGDNTSVVGNGSNRFAIRLVSSAASSLSIAGWEDMSIYMNADTATSTFNLVRVMPAASNKTLKFTFFDAGDAASSGTIKILPPAESSITLSNCTGTGKVTGTLTNCQITGIANSAGWDGKSQTIKVPIPNTYTCNYNQSGGCWFRVQVSFGTGTVTDVTTWSARIEGDPVRLIK